MSGRGSEVDRKKGQEWWMRGGRVDVQKEWRGLGRRKEGGIGMQGGKLVVRKGG